MTSIDESEIMKEHRLRFTTDQDFRLLELLVEINPFEEPSRWSRLHEVFTKEFNKPHSLRACREHVNTMIRQYIRGSTKSAADNNRYSSLMEEVMELKRKSNSNPSSKSLRSDGMDSSQFSMDLSDGSQSVSSTTTTSNSDKKLSLHLLNCTNPDNCDCKDKLKWDVTVSTAQTSGQDYSYNFVPQGESAVDGFQTNNFSMQYSNNFINSEVPPSEVTDSVVLAYLKGKFSVEKAAKEKELALEERKLALQEKDLELQKEKFELDRLERSRRLEIELKERELHMRVIEQQQNLINIYMKNTHFRM